MASGRVGGSRSKISGQVGNTIYQVKRNPDGSYSQISMSKGTITKVATTPRLQAQRMCTSMVESLMRDLKEVGRISMQSGVNKSKSLNAFSSFNLRLVAQDCKAHWSTGNHFVYPVRRDDSDRVQDLGGLYMISSGTLQWNLFDGFIKTSNGFYQWDGLSYPFAEFYGVRFSCPLGVCSVDQFMKAHNMTRLDSVVFCAFRTWVDVADKNGNSDNFYKHSWIIAQINPEITGDTIITADNVASVFSVKTNHVAAVITHKASGQFAMGFEVDPIDKDEVVYYWAAFSISYATGKKLISRSSYASPYGENTPYVGNAAPADVFWSWTGGTILDRSASPFV